MDTEQYLKMIDAQIREAKELVESTEKSFREATARHQALLSSKESYIWWVVNGGDVEKNKEVTIGG